MEHETLGVEHEQELLQDIDRLDAAFGDLFYCLMRWNDLMAAEDQKILCGILDGWREKVHALVPEPQAA